MEDNIFFATSSSYQGSSITTTTTKTTTAAAAAANITDTNNVINTNINNYAINNNNNNNYHNYNIGSSNVFTADLTVSTSSTLSTAAPYSVTDAAMCNAVSEFDGGMLLNDALELVALCLISDIDPQRSCASQEATADRHLLTSVMDGIIASLFQCSWVEENCENIRAEVDRLVAWILLQLVHVPRSMQHRDQQLPRDTSGEITSTTMTIDDRSFRESLQRALFSLLNCLLVKQKRIVVKHTVRPFPHIPTKSSNAGYIVRVGKTKRFFPYV